MGEKIGSGIGDQVELVVHLVADGDGRPAKQLVILDRTAIVCPEGPFAILIKSEGDAADASASRPRRDALQPYGFKFLDGFLGAVHSGLLSLANSAAFDGFQQARPA